MSAILAATAVACNEPLLDHVVTGTFGNRKAIGLNYYIPSNTSGEVVIEAFAEVPVGTPAVLELNGSQQWTCRGTFVQNDSRPDTGNSAVDRVTSQPEFGLGFEGPSGPWRVTVEIPSVNAVFSHTWTLGLTGGSADDLRGAGPSCSQVALTLVQQQHFVQTYLDQLHGWLSRPSVASQPGVTDMRRMLDAATQAKIKGDGETDAAQRTTDYQSSAASLTALARFATADVSLPSDASVWISGLSSSAATLLLQAGLS